MHTQANPDSLLIDPYVRQKVAQWNRIAAGSVLVRPSDLNAAQREQAAAHYIARAEHLEITNGQ